MIARRVLLALALSLAACSAAEAPEDRAPGGGGSAPQGCAACTPDERCVDDVCLPPTAEGCTFEADPRCPEGTLCVVDTDVLCPGDACLPEIACGAPIGDRRGGYACSADDECRSGACAGGLCVQLCVSDGDCDGITCVTIALPRGGAVKSCAATDALGVPDLATTRCGGDSDCGEGQVCRRVIGDPYDAASIARCAPIDPARSPARAACAWAGSPRQPTESSTPEALAADATCQTGDCFGTCGVSANDLCFQPRCAAPCDASDDCPAREVCAVVPYSVVPHARPYYICQAPPRGCFAERDCCPTEDAGGCFQSWEVERTHCAPSRFQGRFVTSCVFPEGRAVPGSRCTSDADCASGLCLPDAPGGVQACAFVCDELAYEGDCATATGVAGARCGTTPRTIEGVAVEVPVCLAP